jgi:hypothetical protein
MEACGESLRGALRQVGRNGGGREHQRWGLGWSGIVALAQGVGDFEHAVAQSAVKASVRSDDEVREAIAGGQSDAGARRVGGEIGGAEAET